MRQASVDTLPHDPAARAALSPRVRPGEWRASPALCVLCGLVAALFLGAAPERALRRPLEVDAIPLSNGLQPLVHRLRVVHAEGGGPVAGLHVEVYACGVDSVSDPAAVPAWWMGIFAFLGVPRPSPSLRVVPGPRNRWSPISAVLTDLADGTTHAEFAVADPARGWDTLSVGAPSRAEATFSNPNSRLAALFAHTDDDFPLRDAPLRHFVRLTPTARARVAVIVSGKICTDIGASLGIAFHDRTGRSYGFVSTDRSEVELPLDVDLFPFATEMRLRCGEEAAPRALAAAPRGTEPIHVTRDTASATLVISLEAIPRDGGDLVEFGGMRVPVDLVPSPDTEERPPEWETDTSARRGRVRLSFVDPSGRVLPSVRGRFGGEIEERTLVAGIHEVDDGPTVVVIRRADGQLLAARFTIPSDADRLVRIHVP